MTMNLPMVNIGCTVYINFCPDDSEETKHRLGHCNDYHIDELLLQNIQAELFEKTFQRQLSTL